MKGKNVVLALKKGFRVTTDRELAKRLGITGQSLQNWKNRARVTERQIASLVRKASRRGATEYQQKAIRPIVEFYPITKRPSKQGAKWELFQISHDGTKHPYAAGLHDELKSSYGIYIFFDSRGSAIYTGKARRQTLWREMKAAFNRERGEIQSVKRVRHPSRKQRYRSSNEKARQIREQVVPLHELAAYFSAYQVADEMINELEAMLVRGFANDLLNSRMERFGQQRSTRKS